MRKGLRCHIHRMITAIDRQQARVTYNEALGRYDVFPAIMPARFSDKRLQDRALFVLEMELSAEMGALHFLYRRLPGGNDG